MSIHPPPPDQTRVAGYQPIIVWGTGTGISTAEYDDVSGWYLNQPGLVVDGIGRDQIRAYSPPAAPALDLTLNNWTGRFSPGGPIGNFVGRGPKVTLWATRGIDVGCNADQVRANDPSVLANGYDRMALFQGSVNTAEQALTRPNRSVSIRALGVMATLLDKRPVTSQLYENIPTDQAITAILDAVGWPVADRVIDSGDTVLAYWWLDGSQTAMSALQAILTTEGAGGAAYEQAGVFHFEGRQYRQNADRSVNTQWVIASTSASSLGLTPPANSSLINANDANTLANGSTANLLQDVIPTEVRSNPDEVLAAATATINQRIPTPPIAVPQTYMKVWEYGGPLTLTAGQVVVIRAQGSDPFKLAQTPVLGTDYTVTGGAVAVVLLDTSGVTARIQITAAAATTVNGATSNGIQLRAVGLPVTSTQAVRSTIDTGAMATRYAAKELQMSVWPELSPTVALNIVNSMVTRYKEERRQAVIRLVNLDAEHLAAIFRIRVSDRITWIQQHGAINDPYWVEQIHHEIAPGGGLHTVTLGCERVFNLVGARFDIDRFDAAYFSD